jgi:hypothetical protein
MNPIDMNRAENVGFEPTVPCGTTVFKTAAIDHSANSPRAKLVILYELTIIFCFFFISISFLLNLDS